MVRSSVLCCRFARVVLHCLVLDRAGLNWDDVECYRMEWNVTILCCRLLLALIRSFARWFLVSFTVETFWRDLFCETIRCLWRRICHRENDRGKC